MQLTYAIVFTVCCLHITALKNSRTYLHCHTETFDAFERTV